MSSSHTVSTCLVLLAAVAFAPCGVATNSLRGKAFLQNRIKLLQAQQASQLAQNQHVLEEAVGTLMKEMPSDVDDTSDKSIVGLDTAKDTKQWFVGLVPAPTEEDLQFLRDQASSASSYMKLLAEESKLSPSDAPPACKECQKLSKQGATQILKEKQFALDHISQFASLETKRQKMLPKLVSKMAQAAVKAHKARLEAENKTNQALANASMIEFQNASASDISGALVDKQLHEIDRLRLEDRIRARERLRVAACAMFQADADYRKNLIETNKTSQNNKMTDAVASDASSADTSKTSASLLQSMCSK